MNEEINLVDGLEMAIECIRDLSPCYEGDEWDDSEEAAAISGIRAAQHYVADLAQRVEELEAERDALRAKYDELLVALHGIGAALGIPEGDRSPYSVTCGVLERVNRLAEIEAQEPVAEIRTWHKSGEQHADLIDWCDSLDGLPDGEHKLYARPVPAQTPGYPLTCDVCGAACPDPWHYSSGERRHLHACDACWPGVSRGLTKVPNGWRLVPVEPTPEMINAAVTEFQRERCHMPSVLIQRWSDWTKMVAAAPEAAR